MPCVCFYFQVHQPHRLRRYSVFDTDAAYFDEFRNTTILKKVAQKSYLPANQVLLETLREYGGKFRVAFSLSGQAMEQFEEQAPEVIDSFRDLNATGCVEFLDETYFHSLSFLYSRDEFRAQVEMHRAKVRQLFGQDPRVFRNTELIYNNDLAHFISHMGYDGVLAEGVDAVLGTRSPNHIYHPPHAQRLKLLLRNHRLSDDIAARFGSRSWEQWPLTAEKFAQWISQINGHGEVCNLFMDYESFGERQWADTGIFDFLRHLPQHVLANDQNYFLTPAQVCDKFDSVGDLDVPHMTSWSEEERDLSGWLGNAMQSNALHELYKLEGPLKEKGDPQLLNDWRRMTSSDHFHYMSTKHWTDQTSESRFSPYESPYDSYINFMNVLDNLQSRLRN